ncbi:DNA-binding protein WhiA [Enteractinococcus coprophilus]|uniref:Probable cell division protein WhiA n=1 Tax=Enteractinococcus coprophilus TaxID=1027633 RepID=A0A543AJ68_9MICC|nr:DNA-binding protein WhiA [Enteractinococcus coprophilus]TQL72628.1 hypothetical protein FB556_1294 [Enteractinococcus coprophilus]
MALTATAKDELARVPVTRLSERLAEVVGILRFGGGLQLLPGRLIIETELDHEAAARRLRTTLRDTFGTECELITLAGSASRRGTRYVLRIMDGGAELARKTGLLDPRGRPVRGMPPAVVNGTVADAAAAWRGAFLSQGVLTEPGRSSALEVVAPGPEAALALVGAARRLGVTAKAREVRQADRVVIRDAETITKLLTVMGAEQTVKTWQQRHTTKEVRSSSNRLANFDDANLRRSAQAAVAASARVTRALEILGDDVPEHLAYAGKLRVEHQHASLDKLGRLAEPPMTKDAIAGRIRRLLAMADKRAKDLGLPDTHEAVPVDLRDRN